MPIEDPIDHTGVGRDIIINSISFSEGIVEVNFFEKRDQGENAGLMKMLIARKSDYQVQVNTILDEIEEIVDGALLAIRNPEESFDPRRRVAASAAAGATHEEAE